MNNDKLSPDSAKAALQSQNAGFVDRWRRAKFGGIDVIVTTDFAAQIHQAEEGDASANAGSDGSTFPGLGLDTGEDVFDDDGELPDRAVLFGEQLTTAVADRPVRLCTPLRFPHQQTDSYPETSVSDSSLGSHLAGTGPLGQVAERAAEARGARNALVSVTGTTGANHVAMLMVARRSPGRPVALPYNAHHSLINAAIMFSVNYVIIGGQQIRNEYEAIEPPSAADIRRALSEHPDICAVFITSPSYEGIVANTAAIAVEIDGSDSDCLLVVDQAWGAHFGASALTPASAIRDADIVCESTHKLGGAPNQSGLILWNRSDLDTDIADAYKMLTTTSPSFPLIAGFDDAINTLHNPVGRALLSRAARHAARLSDDLRSNGLDILDNHDPLRVVASTDNIDTTGYALADHLADLGIIVERAGMRSIVFLVGYDTTADHLDTLITAVANAPRLPQTSDRALAELPPAPTGASQRRVGASRPLSVASAVGAIAAELIECYPPGIALIQPGMPITHEAIAYIDAARSAGGSINATDPEMRTIVVDSATVMLTKADRASASR